MKTYVLYHANCYDGFGAAWAAWTALGDDAEYIPVSYGDDDLPAMEDGSIVVIVDFSYDRETLLALAERMEEVTVLDHHKTAEEELAGLDFAIFDQNKSGAVLAWEYWYPHEEISTLLLYVQDRDLWNWNMSHSKEVSAALRSYDMEFEIWDRLAASTLELIDEGAAILRFTDKQVEMICRQTILGEIEGYIVPIVNATAFWSEVGHLLLGQYPHAPFSASWHVISDKRVKWSLRGRDTGDFSDFDVSKVAKVYGGGGHQKAAGMVTGIDLLHNSIRF